MELEKTVEFTNKADYINFKKALAQIDPAYKKLYEEFIKLQNAK